MSEIPGPVVPPSVPHPPGKARAVVPPYPNLGPEPLDDPGRSWPWLAIPGLIILLVVLTAWRRSRNRVRRGPTNPRDLVVEREVRPEDSPPDTIVALAESVREALVSRFGETWRAKTSEEIGDDPGTIDAFGPETASRLVVLLREADRFKFAELGSVAPLGHREELELWAVWASDFVADAGARSTITGK